MPKSGKELARLAKNAGWREVRIHGSHHDFKKNNATKIVTIPIHGNESLGKGLEQKILNDLGLK